MASLSNFTETPNLLELVEAYRNDLTAIWGLSESATCDEKIYGSSRADRTGSHLSHLSICDDDITRGDLSICGDEINRLPSSLIDISPCADDPNQLSLAELSLCADDSIQSVCADEGPADQSVCADEVPSDVRLKTDIEQVGTTAYGLPLYHFRYKTGTERFEGVMAQDVLEVMPDAVVVGEDGYYRVKYRQLGIRMTRA